MKIEPPSVLTLSDLESWSHPDVALAVLGHPIKHSISPPMHRAALAEMARTDPQFASWNYFRFDVLPSELAPALERLHACGFLGLNLTVPHKVLAIAHAVEIDPDAARVGAVNTLRRTPRGWQGFNTDGYGLATAVREVLSRDLAGASVLLLGAGGAARSAAVECLRQNCAALWIANRTRQNLDALLAQLAPVAGEIPLRGFTPDTLPLDLPAGTLVINATSAGLRPDDSPPIDLGLLPRPAGVFDMIYNPPHTPLLRAAERLKIPFANGLSMLVHQGAKSLAIWSGAPVPVEAMQIAARAALAV